MLKELLNICEKDTIISLHTNLDDISKFVFGKVLCVNNKEYAFYMISPDGEYDGVLIKRTDEIVYFEIDSQYSKEMQKLYPLYNLPQPNIIFDNNNIITSLLLYALEAKGIVSLEINYSGFDDVVGFVKNIHEDICEIQQIDSFGLDDGSAFVTIENITQISCDSLDERRILERQKKRTQEDGSSVFDEN